MPKDKANKLKKLAQLKDVKKLYDCQIRCLSAVTFLVKNDLLEPEQIDVLWDPNRTCANQTIREFLCGIMPEIGQKCVCSDLFEKIKSVAAFNSFLEVKCPPVPETSPEKK